MDLELAGRVAVVTAGGDGIGLGIVEALAAEGVEVVTADLDTSRLEGKPGVTAHRLDLVDPNGCDELVAAAVEAHGRLDILVNGLGNARMRDQGFESLGDDDWRWAFEINFMGMVRASRAALPHLKEAPDGGAIISIASDAARESGPLFVDYCAAKSSVLSLSKALAVEYAPQVRSNVVSPGSTRTPGFHRFFAAMAEDRGMTEEEVEHEFAVNIRQIPTGRVGLPEEVASMVVFLASPRSAQMNGSEYCVNGGVLKAV